MDLRDDELYGTSRRPLLGDFDQNQAQVLIPGPTGLARLNSTFGVDNDSDEAFRRTRQPLGMHGSDDEYDALDGPPLPHRRGHLSSLGHSGDLHGRRRHRHNRRGGIRLDRGPGGVGGSDSDDDYSSRSGLYDSHHRPSSRRRGTTAVGSAPTRNFIPPPGSHVPRSRGSGSRSGSGAGLPSLPDPSVRGISPALSITDRSVSPFAGTVTASSRSPLSLHRQSPRVGDPQAAPAFPDHPEALVAPAGVGSPARLVPGTQGPHKAPFDLEQLPEATGFPSGAPGFQGAGGGVSDGPTLPSVEVGAGLGTSSGSGNGAAHAAAHAAQLMASPLGIEDESPDLYRPRAVSHAAPLSGSSDTDYSRDGRSGYGGADDEDDDDDDNSSLPLHRSFSARSRGRRHSRPGDHSYYPPPGPVHDNGVTYVRSWLFFVRRILVSYYFLASFVLILNLSIKACLEIAFGVVTPLLEHVTVASTLEFAASFFVLLFCMTTLLTSNWTLIQSAWSGRELLELKRFECGAVVYRGSPGSDTWDYVVQFLYHGLLEIGPFVVGFVAGVQESSMRLLVGFWLFSAMIVATCLVILFTALTVLRYTRYFFVIGIDDAVRWWRSRREKQGQSTVRPTPPGSPSASPSARTTTLRQERNPSVLLDVCTCVRKCYFAEETPAAKRCVKPIPVMIHQRYYERNIDRSSRLEFLPPRQLHTRNAKFRVFDEYASALCPCIRTRQRQLGDPPPNLMAFPVTEQRNLLYVLCSQRFHCPLAPFVAAVTATSLVFASAVSSSRFSEGGALALALSAGALVWVTWTYAAAFRSKQRQQLAKNAQPQSEPLQLGAEQVYVNFDALAAAGSLGTSTRTSAGPSSGVWHGHPVASQTERTPCSHHLRPGSIFWRRSVPVFAFLSLAFFFVGLLLAAKDKPGVVSTLTTSVLFACLTVAVVAFAVPSGRASYFFKTLVPPAAVGTLLATLSVPLACDHCSWVVYPAMIFVFACSLLLLARLQVMGTAVANYHHHLGSGKISTGGVVRTTAGHRSTAGSEKRKKKLEQLHIERFLCGRVAAFLVLTLALFFSALFGLSRGFDPVSDRRPGALPPTARNASIAPYPVCDMHWHGLTAIDLGLMTSLAYLEGPALYKDFDAFFNSSEWHIDFQSDTSARFSVFYEFHKPSANLSVIAIRGSTASRDVLKDIDIWMEATLLQYTLFQLPGFSLITDETVSWLVDQMVWLEGEFAASSEFWDPIIDHIAVNTSKHSSHIIIAGHSLGGGLAKIVGCKIRRPAFSLSGPGMFYTRGKVGISADELESYSVNIVPDHDVIPRIDLQSGLIQHIKCPIAKAQRCHSCRRSVMQLISSCGDPKGRGLVVH